MLIEIVFPALICVFAIGTFGFVIYHENRIRKIFKQIEDIKTIMEKLEKIIYTPVELCHDEHFEIV